MKKTILVTGGAGFIGSNFIYLILKERLDWKVICVDALTYAANIHTLDVAMKNPKFVFYKEDIRNREGIFGIFEREKPDIVVNFAAESHVDRSIENPSVFLETNILGTQVMMDACRKYGVERFHQVGTDEVYGDLPLEMQKDIFNVLDCSKRIGLTLNESLLMSPSKSVTAIIGISKDKCGRKHEAECKICNKKDCLYRRNV